MKLGRPFRHIRPGILLAVAAVMLLSQSGCVRRRLTVHSNPPGALVYVDNQQIGVTPGSVDFVYYGTREIRLVKAGYETLTINQPIPAPWYQVPPLDFASENLVPYKIRDNRTVTYNLAPQVLIPTEELIDRGQQLRQATIQQTPAPLPVAPAPMLPPVGGSIMPPPAVFPQGAATVPQVTPFQAQPTAPSVTAPAPPGFFAPPPVPPDIYPPPQEQGPRPFRY